MRAARSRQSLFGLRLAVGVHKTGLRLGHKAEQREEGTKGGRAQETGQRSGTGHGERVQHDSLVVTVLRSTSLCRWDGPTPTSGMRRCKACSTSAALERRGGRGPNMDKQALCRAAAPGTHHTSLLLHRAPILPHESRHAALSTEGKPLEPMPPRGRFHTGTGDSP